MILLDVNLWIPVLRIAHAQHDFVTEWMAGLQVEREINGGTLTCLLESGKCCIMGGMITLRSDEPV